MSLGPACYIQRREYVVETPHNAKHTASKLRAPSFRPSALWFCHGSQLSALPVSAGLLACSWSGFLCDKDSSSERRDRCVCRRRPSDAFVVYMLYVQSACGMIPGTSQSSHSPQQPWLCSLLVAESIHRRHIAPLVLVHLEFRSVGADFGL